MSTGRISLAQQLVQLDRPAPVDYDPEDLAVHERGSDDEERNVSSAAREHYFEVGQSSLRKLHDSIADPKYEGVKTSRKKLLEISDEDEDEDEGDEDVAEDEGRDGEEDFFKEDALREEDPPSESEEDQEIESEAEEEEPENEKPSLPSTENLRPQEKSRTTDDLSNALQKTREEDLRKGKAVMRQLNMWGSLLDARIRLQKTTTTVNRIASSTSRSLLESPECQEELNKYLEESLLLAEDLFELQETILNMNEIATPPPRKKRRIQEDDDLESYTTYFAEASTSSVKLEQAVHPWLVQTLGKWSAKIQAVAPSVLLPSNRNAFSKNTQNITSAPQLVDEALLDHPRLLAKTRIPRGKAKNEPANGKEEDSEVFDDTDFYQQLLRDVIESRGEGADGADDWMALQREKKAKKKVDTKASKGRKIRYEVHEKLQNFMVPVPVVGAWHEEQTDELFASLLGKGFESSLADEALLPSEGIVEVEEAIKDGFRVFG